MTARLQDKVAIVTGGGVGIGRVYCESLAVEGVHVVVADVNDEGIEHTVDAIAKAGNSSALGVHTDVADQRSVESMAQTVVERFGRIDILVNNAALFTSVPMKEFDEVDVEEWDRVMAVNLRGPFLCAKAVLPHMRAQNHGKIINIASAAIFSGNPRRVHYVTSKAGLVGFTRALARVGGRHNITVNAILPGSTASDTAMEAYGGMQSFERQAAGRAIARVMIPQDLVGAVLFLASPESDFITGQSLVVDGGLYMQ